MYLPAYKQYANIIITYYNIARVYYIIKYDIGLKTKVKLFDRYSYIQLHARKVKPTMRHCMEN